MNKNWMMRNNNNAVVFALAGVTRDEAVMSATYWNSIVAQNPQIGSRIIEGESPDGDWFLID